MAEKLCIFCEHFRWKKEEQWGMGSTLTGPMMEGGNASCDAGMATDWPYMMDDESDWRRVIVTAQKCPEYKQVEP